MIDVDEVRVHLSDSKFVECYLGENVPGFMGECIFPPMVHSRLKTLYRSPMPCPTTDECDAGLVGEAERSAGKFPKQSLSS